MFVDPGDLIMWSLQFWIRNNNHLGLTLLFDFGNRSPFFIQQIGRHNQRYSNFYLHTLLLIGFLLNDAQYGKRKGFHIPN